MEFGFQDTTETMAFISNIPFVKKLIKQNIKLQKKNKELKQLIKLITKNFDLFQHEEKLEIVGKPIKLEKTDLDVTELDDEVLVVEAPQNIKYEVHEIESDDTDVVNPCSNETPIENSFDTILSSVKTIKDYNNLTIFYQKLWLQNNSLDSLIKKEPEEKVIKVKEEEEEEKDAFKKHDLELQKIIDQEDEEDEVVEEEEVEEEEVEEEEVEEEEVEEEEVEEEEEEEEEEEDVYEIIINKKTYYTNDMKNGILYADDNGEVGEEVGKLTDGVHKFNKKKK